jgi:hypothetical protein
MSNDTKMKITEEKVWMKYYSEEAHNYELPHCTAYEYLQQRMPSVSMNPQSTTTERTSPSVNCTAG